AEPARGSAGGDVQDLGRDRAADRDQRDQHARGQRLSVQDHAAGELLPHGQRAGGGFQEGDRDPRGRQGGGGPQRVHHDRVGAVAVGDLRGHGGFGQHGCADPERDDHGVVAGHRDAGGGGGDGRERGGGELPFDGDGSAGAVDRQELHPAAQRGER